MQTLNYIYPNVDQGPSRIPTNIDTLEKSIWKMQLKIDSLQNIVNKTEIGKGFFTEIISLQLGIFIFILSFAAVLGWKWFSIQLIKTRRENKNYTDKEILELEEKFNFNKNDVESKYENLEIGLDETIYDVNRAMYSKVLKDQDWANAFDWGLACAKMLYKIRPEDLDDVVGWLEMIEVHISEVEVGNQILISGMSRILETLKTFENIEDEKIKNIYTIIFKMLHHIVYTIPSVPEDFVERPEDSVVENNKCSVEDIDLLESDIRSNE